MQFAIFGSVSQSLKPMAPNFLVLSDLNLYHGKQSFKNSQSVETPSILFSHLWKRSGAKKSCIQGYLAHKKLTPSRTLQ